jgi:hypothetical protein
MVESAGADQITVKDEPPLDLGAEARERDVVSLELSAVTPVLT